MMQNIVESAQRGALIGPNDSPPFESLTPEGKTPLLLVCDHASQAIPEHLGFLGLAPEQMGQHIAYDIGVAALTRHLSRMLDAPAVLSGFSRLLIDPNRHPGDPTAIPEISDGIKIPGNQSLDEEAQNQRIETFFTPYHHEISTKLAHLWRHGPAPALFSIHSFTPAMNGKARPWDIGVLWNHDPRIALPLLEGLNRHGGLVVGDNEPYSGLEIAYTLDRHGGAAGLPNCAIEIRQDLLSNEAGIEHWAIILANILREIMAEPDLHRVEMY